MAPPSKRQALANMTVEDADALDCGVCYLPLRSPIFQCRVGHVVCSPCHDKLLTTKCHVCRAPTIGGYRRNHAIEKLVESIRVSYPNAPYGCPADACSFAGSTAALLDHFIVFHEWPCTEARGWKRIEVHLRDEFNTQGRAGPVNTFKVDSNDQQYLFLLNVARNPYGHAISVFFIHPQAAVNKLSSPTPRAVEFFVRLEYSRNQPFPGDMCSGHSQDTKFRVACTDLSGGMPNSEECFQFFLPKSVQPRDMETATFMLTIWQL
ncbi:unnamed protein product [Alopecurus aequalis]